LVPLLFVGSIYFSKNFKLLKKIDTYQVTIVSGLNVSVTCPFVVVLFSFVQFNPYICYFCSI